MTVTELKNRIDSRSGSYLAFASCNHYRHVFWSLIACPHCRRKVRLSHKSATVAEFSRFLRQSHFCETVSLVCDSLTFLRQCGQGFMSASKNAFAVGR